MKSKTLHPFLMRTAVTLAVMMITMMAFPTGARAQSVTKVSTWTALRTAAETAATTATPVSIELEQDIARDYNYPIVVSSSVTMTLDLHGHKINGMGDSYPYYNIFDVFNGGNLTITDLSDAKDGEIYGARSDIISITSSGIVTLAAGTLGKSGGGVSVNTSSSFTMTGGTINTVGGTGVVLSGSSFTMTGGTITGNNYGVDIANPSSCTMTVSGPTKVTISGNTTADVFMQASVKPIVIGGDLHPDTRIGVSTSMSTGGANGLAFTSGLGTHGSASNFFRRNDDLGIVAEGSELYFGQLMATNDAGGTLGKWCSYYNFGPRHMRACSGVTAYKAKVNAAKTGVELTELFTDGGVINNGQGVLLKSDGDIVLMTTSANPDGDYEGNELTGANSDADQGSNDGKCYVLSKQGDTFGFFLLQSGVQTKAHKAYLIVEPSSSGARGFLGFGDDDTTGIVDIEHGTLNIEHETLNIEHGTWNMEHLAGAWYSLDGRRLIGKPSAKGVYIHNGRKEVVR